MFQSSKPGSSSSNKKPPQKNGKLSQRILTTLRDPSFQVKAAGVGIGVLALGAFAISQTGSTRRATESGKYRGPPPMKREEVDALYNAAIESLQRKSSQQNTPRGLGGDDGDDGITPEFRTLYKKITHAAPPNQYEPDVRCTIAEFLIVHARFENIAHQSPQSPAPPLSMGQANYIREWVAFETSYDSTPLSTIANRIDILYRVAMAQKSVADLRALYTWLCSSHFPDPLTESSHTTDDNFFAIYVQHRFLLACLFGLWDEARVYGVPLDNIILPRSRMKLKQSFTQRAMSRPHAQCNFNQIGNKLDDISERFGLELRPPVRFETWPIYLFKVKKIHSAKEVAEYKEEDIARGVLDWQHFVAGGGLASNRGSENMVKNVYVFGACIQFISPIQGVAGNLPVTGTWNDSDMYVGMEWTFNAGPQSDPSAPPLLIRKSIDVNLERVGHSSSDDILKDNDVKSTETDEAKGWLWTGEMNVVTKQGRMDGFGKITFEVAAHNRYQVVMVIGSRD